MTKSSTVISEVAVGGREKLKWKGLNTAVKDARFLEIGESPDSINWVTSRDGDNIQLRRGSALLGKTRRSSGKISGLGVGTIGSTQVPFFSANRSIYYYNAATGDTQEVASANILPTGASGEDVNFMTYQNLAGSFMFATSPHSSIYKIPVANPANVLDQQSSDYRFSFAKIDQNRMWGLGRFGTKFAPDFASTYISNVDKTTYSAYTPTVNETHTSGDGVTKLFSGTITGAGGKVSIFDVLIAGAITAGTSISNMVLAAGLVTITSNGHGRSVGDLVMTLGTTYTGSFTDGNVMTVTKVTDANNIVVSPFSPISVLSYGSGGTLYAVEVFVDDKQGNMASQFGGTGTVNYATGSYSVTFNTAPTNSVATIANYYTDDATSGGVADFSFATNSPSIGQGYQFQQGGGGRSMASAGFQGIEYVFYQLKSWLISLPTTTTASYGDAQNNEYWSHIGIPYFRAVFPTGDGILFLDNTNPAQPKYSILQIAPGSTNLTVIPVWISQALDLSLYDFSSAVVFRFGEYNVLACKQYLNGLLQSFNSVFFIQNIASGDWNQLDYEITSLAEFLGALISGDSLSPNIFTLFSGTDDDGSVIANHWKSGSSDLGFNGIKKCNFLNIEGLIQKSQNIDVMISLDGANYVKYFTISGNGNYVNSSAPVGVGSNTVGSNVIGGGGTITALPFTVDIPINTDLFQYISVQFQATSVGWAQINRMAFRDIRLKRRRLLPYSEGVQE